MMTILNPISARCYPLSAVAIDRQYVKKSGSCFKREPLFLLCFDLPGHGHMVLPMFCVVIQSSKY